MRGLESICREESRSHHGISSEVGRKKRRQALDKRGTSPLSQTWGGRLMLIWLREEKSTKIRTSREKKKKMRVEENRSDVDSHSKRRAFHRPPRLLSFPKNFLPTSKSFPSTSILWRKNIFSSYFVMWTNWKEKNLNNRRDLASAAPKGSLTWTRKNLFFIFFCLSS